QNMPRSLATLGMTPSYNGLAVPYSRSCSLAVSFLRVRSSAFPFCYIFRKIMRNRYHQWMHNWETRLTTRDTNRVVRPLEWGVEWARHWPLVNGNYPAKATDYERFIHELNESAVRHSDEFFGYPTPADFRLERHRVHVKAKDGTAKAKAETADFLRFTSPVSTPYPENNTANARWFRARGRRAVVVLPQWNSDVQ